jgi:hypothetical protein
MGKIKQLLTQPANSARVEIFREELHHAQELFKVRWDQSFGMYLILLQIRLAGSNLSQILQAKKDVREQYEELAALLDAKLDLTGSDYSSVRFKLIFEFGVRR